MSGLWATLADLVLPNPCAGCGRQGEPLRFDVCADCVRAVEGLRAFPTRPVPEPPGLPPCYALGEYGGELRELLIGYKEKSRHRLAEPLGALLAEAIAAAGPVLPLVYIPDTGGAARRRHGDHMRALALHAAETLRHAGRSTVVINALVSRSRPDSARLGAGGRAEAAVGKFELRRRTLPEGAEVLLVDDIITTGSTLAAATRTLAGGGVVVRACVALAATQLRAHG